MGKYRERLQTVRVNTIKNNLKLLDVADIVQNSDKYKEIQRRYEQQLQKITKLEKIKNDMKMADMRQEWNRQYLGSLPLLKSAKRFHNLGEHILCAVGHSFYSPGVRILQVSRRFTTRGSEFADIHMSVVIPRKLLNPEIFDEFPDYAA